jgi:hypothetical protein
VSKKESEKRRRFVARVARRATAPYARLGIKGPENSVAIRSLGRPSARSIFARIRGARRLNYKDDVAHTPKAKSQKRFLFIFSGVASFLFLMYERRRLRSHTRRCARCQKAPPINSRSMPKSGANWC